MAGTTWNPSDKGASVTLSNANLTAQVATASPNGVRAVASTSVAPTKWYWEVHVDTLTGNNLTLGVADATASITTTSFGNDTHSAVLNTVGSNIIFNGGVVGTCAVAQGDVIGFALDSVGRTLKVYRANALQATLTTAQFPSGACFPCFGGNANAGATTVTARFAASDFSFTPPTGYSDYVAPLTFSMTGNVAVKVPVAATVVPIPGFIGNVRVSLGPAASFVFATSQRYTITTSGGATLGDTAPLTYIPVNIYTITPDGGAIVAGDPLITDHLVFIPTGGAVIGGAAIVQDLIPFVATGGVILGGIPDREAIFAIVPTGSAILGGSSTTLFIENVTPLGGATLGGSAGTVYVATPLPTGGATVSGAPAISSLLVNIFNLSNEGIPAGGAVLSGAAGITSLAVNIYAITPDGGAVLSGFATAYMVPSGFTTTPENPNADAFPGWSINFDTGAPARYAGLPANSIGQFQGRTVVANAAGIYVLDAKTDAGAPIHAFVMTPLSDYGDAHNKRVPQAWIAARAADELILKAITSSGSQHYYTVPPSEDAMRASRVSIGKGLEGRYWQFGLANVAGGDFQLESLVFEPTQLKRHGR